MFEAVAVEVYVIATRPYPEKVAGGRFYMDVEDAKRAWSEMDVRFRSSFKIFPALMAVGDVDMKEIKHECQG